MRASLAGPAGIALVGSGRRLTVYIADYYNGSVRAVGADGIVSTIGGPRRFITPSRLAYRSGGWLYVASDSGSVTAVNVTKGRPYQIATAARRIRKVT